jgi:DNA repair protein RadA/Sms
MSAFLSIGQPKVKIDSNILDVVIPKEMENAIPTGHPYIDKLYAGDGVLAGTVSLVTGSPGAGKSTLMVDLADKLSGIDHLALYVTGEESLYQVRRVVKRLDLKNGFIPSYNIMAQDIIEQCEALKAKYGKKKLFLFIDSLQCLRMRREEGIRGRNASDEKQMMDGMTMITEYAKNHWMPTFFIGHVNKKDEFAGKQTIKHLIDAHLHLELDADPETGVEERILSMKKNRFGPSGTYYQAEMSERGLKFETKPKEAVKAAAGKADDENEFGPDE